MEVRKILARIKRKLTTPPFIKDQRYPPFWFERLLGNQSVYVVQIGSNDGKTGDPLYTLLQKHKNWQALFVEPVPYSFEKLKKNYSDHDRFRFENVAINNGEQLTFYWVDQKAKSFLPDLPFWYDQLGSFDKQHILNHFDGALQPFILSAQLEGITLPVLFERNSIGKIDILHIDTEGSDWKILSQLDQKKHGPKFILFEYNHLSEKDYKSACAFLDENYLLFKIGIDMFAVNKHLDTSFLRVLKKKLKVMN